MSWPKLRWVAGFTVRHSSMVHLVEADQRRMNSHARIIVDAMVADINAPRRLEAFELVPVEAMDAIRAFVALTDFGGISDDFVAAFDALPPEVKP